jgi:hypothetical protein
MTIRPVIAAIGPRHTAYPDGFEARWVCEPCAGGCYWGNRWILLNPLSWVDAEMARHGLVRVKEEGDQ